MRGQLLIASPAILDPNFRRAVILIGHHDEQGALGVVINRPAGSTVADAAPPVAEMIGDGELHLGGPVMPEAVVILAEFERPEDAAMLAFDNVGVLATDTPAEQIGEKTTRIRAFAGHAGWSAGQLDEEMERSDWVVTPADADTVFADDLEGLWATALTELGGSYELLARMPDDPSLN
ncbi:MAG: YqgE/AlgH family protein [Solirubrobacterales bacterium]|nr:YqgE/AlgH family protein [Solirubrobacterales bacterium]